MMMKILVTGYTGQLGSDVFLEGIHRGYEMIGISSKEVNLVNEQLVYDYIKAENPDAIIHCAAYTAVDQAEKEKERCWDINVNGTRYLVNAAKEIQAKFMYISTDYVFEGIGDIPYKETDITNPVNYYGRSKLEGEKIVQSHLTDWFIIRISWVFGRNGRNFVKSILKLAEKTDELNIVGDQIGSPTYSLELSRLLLDMIGTDKYGIYHATNEGYCSWAEFAKEIIRLTGKNVKVNAIKTEEYPTLAVRPKNSRLSKQKLVEAGFRPLSHWKEAVKHYLDSMEKR